VNILTTTEAGKVLRAIGVDGSLQVLAHYTHIELSPGEALFLWKDGEQVPYFIESVEQQDERLFLVRLEDILNKEQVRSFVQHPFWLLSGKAGSEEDEEKGLIGWTVYDSDETKLGSIESVTDMGSYLLLSVVYNEKEILLPLHDDLLIEMDESARKLVMAIPDGMLNLED
jgi:16S rRNA processing protein RimM